MNREIATSECTRRLHELGYLTSGRQSGRDDLLDQILDIALRSAAPKLILWGRERVTFYNDAYAAIDPEMGCSGLGKSFPGLEPECWRLMEDHLVRAASGVPCLKETFEVKRRRPGREVPWIFEASFTPIIDRDGLQKGILIDIVDLTDARQSSERLLFENRKLQKLFAEAPVLIAFGSGEDLRLEFVNRAFQEFYCSRPLKGLPVHEALPEAEEQGFGELLREVMRTETPFVGTNMPVTIRDGATEHVKYVDFIYQPVRGETSEVVGVLCIGKDVTERALAQKERDSLRHRILHASRVNAMGTMAMTLAHELNQPLSAASNFIAAAGRFAERAARENAADIRAALDEANKQVLRAGEIIRRLRPLVRSGAANRRPVSIVSAVDGATGLLQAAGAPAIKVTKQIDPATAIVLADEVQLEQVLLNLFRNAGEASRDSTRKEVIIKTEALKENRVLVSVRDFGRGLALETSEGVSDSSLDDNEGNLGVGLSLCRTLIEANGGQLQGMNAHGGGAVFIFDLERVS